MTPQDWHALRRYLRLRKNEIIADIPDPQVRPHAHAMIEIDAVQDRMRQILSRRRRQRKQVA